MKDRVYTTTIADPLKADPVHLALATQDRLSQLVLLIENRAPSQLIDDLRKTLDRYLRALVDRPIEDLVGYKVNEAYWAHQAELVHELNVAHDPGADSEGYGGPSLVR